MVICAIYISTDTKDKVFEHSHLTAVLETVLEYFPHDSILMLGDFNTFSYKSALKEWVDIHNPSLS